MFIFASGIGNKNRGSHSRFVAINGYFIRPSTKGIMNEDVRGGNHTDESIPINHSI